MEKQIIKNITKRENFLLNIMALIQPLFIIASIFPLLQILGMIMLVLNCIILILYGFRLDFALDGTGISHAKIWIIFSMICFAGSVFFSDFGMTLYCLLEVISICIQNKIYSKAEELYIQRRERF